MSKRKGNSKSLLPISTGSRNYHQYLATTTDPHGKPKYTTRHLAALDFLLNIPMTNEQSIRELGLENANRVQSIEETAQRVTELDLNDETAGLLNIEDYNPNDINNVPLTSESTSQTKNYFSRGYPIINSIIRYDSDDPSAQPYELPTRDWRGYSYNYLFKSIEEEYSLSNDKHSIYLSGFLYDPEFIDDTSYRNDFLVFLDLPVELATIALAVINYERLLIKNVINKSNKKLTICISMLLAYKFTTFNTSKLITLYDFIDKNFSISKKQLIDIEFPAYVHLNFTLHIPVTHLHYIYTKLLKLLNITSITYLTEEMHQVYMNHLKSFESNILDTNVNNKVSSKSPTISNKDKDSEANSRRWSVTST